MVYFFSFLSSVEDENFEKKNISKEFNFVSWFGYLPETLRLIGRMFYLDILAPKIRQKRSSLSRFRF